MARVELVGIVNVTPDSFSDGSKYFEPSAALDHANSLILDGASYLDVGAESTRFGAETIPLEEEWRRLKPVLEALVPANPGHLSVDTRNPETVRRVVSEIGIVILNDVTTFNDPRMIETAAELRLQCIVSHLPEAAGTDIQAAHSKENHIDSVAQVRDELLDKRDKMIAAGIAKEMIILDPGIGFGKTRLLNWQLIRFAQEVPGIEVMIGYSKKHFLGSNPETGEPLPEKDTLRKDTNVNLAAGQMAVQSGAKYLRVHDVASHRTLLT